MSPTPLLYRLTSLVSECDTGREANVTTLIAIDADTITITSKPLDEPGPVHVITVKRYAEAYLLRQLIEVLHGQ